MVVKELLLNPFTYFKEVDWNDVEEADKSMDFFAISYSVCALVELSVTFYYMAYFLRLGHSYFNILKLTDKSLKEGIVYTVFSLLLIYLVIFHLRTTAIDACIYIWLFLSQNPEKLGTEHCPPSFKVLQIVLNYIELAAYPIIASFLIWIFRYLA